jgi:hypothetical protein
MEKAIKHNSISDTLTDVSTTSPSNCFFVPERHGVVNNCTSKSLLFPHDLSWKEGSGAILE